MVQFKRLLASALVSVTLISNLSVAFASEVIQETDITNIGIEQVTDETNSDISVDDLNIQLNDLYHEVGDELHINYIYVKILHMLAGGKAVYADNVPNIYVEETVDTLSGPFDIVGASTTYDLQAPWVVCPDDSIKRTSKYYLPDAAYNVTAEIISIMNSRYVTDRGILQDYFNALSNDVKTNILFCEAILQYTGSSADSVNSFYKIYEKIIYDKECDENVLEAVDGVYKFKEQFEEIIRKNGIETDREIEILSLVLSFDSKLAASSTTDELYDSYVFPYKPGYTSRENMMLAAMSIVGKVRYVWGGGHLSSGSIEGINPTWEMFYNTYGTAEGEPGYDNCIRPNNGWCPIHGTVNGGNGCLMISTVVNSTDDYLDVLSEAFDVTPILNQKEKFDNLMNSVDLERGISSHRLDGLDCSGYASWLYNQITNAYNYDSGAIRFISQAGVKPLSSGTELLPGDVFSWGDHIIVIVGAVEDDSKAYVMIESGPNTVKFGVAYYSGAKPADIELAKQVALEANAVLGNLTDVENVRVFNMNTLVYINPDNEEDPYNGYQGWGRYKGRFIDENIILSDFGERMIDMTAVEIIQHTIDNLPYQYVSGLDTYIGSIFNTSKVERQLVDVEGTKVIEDEIVLNDELNQGVNIVEQETKASEAE